MTGTTLTTSESFFSTTMSMGLRLFAMLARLCLGNFGVLGGVRVTRWLDEEQAAVDTRILDVAFALRRELLAQECRVLVFDVLDDGVPATVVIDLVSVTWGINDVQAKPDAVLLNDCNAKS
jgi:hypothetical protein